MKKFGPIAEFFEKVAEKVGKKDLIGAAYFEMFFSLQQYQDKVKDVLEKEPNVRRLASEYIIVQLDHLTPMLEAGQKDANIFREIFSQGVN